MNRVTPPSSTGIVSSSTTGAAGSPGADGIPAPFSLCATTTRRIASDEPLGPHRLHDVVGGREGEGVDRVLVVGGDEDDLGSDAEARDDPGQGHAVQPRHRDVAEDDVDVAAVEHLERLGAARRGDDLGDAVVAPEEVAEVGQRRQLVVDDERGESARRWRTWARAYDQRLRRGMDAGSELGHAERSPSCPPPPRSRRRGRTRRRRPGAAGRRRCRGRSSRWRARRRGCVRTRCGSVPTPSSSMQISASEPRSLAVIVRWPTPSLPASPWRTAFSTRGCTAR